MSQMDAKATRERILERLTHFVHTYRIALWVVLAALLVFTVAYFIFTERQKKLREDSTILVEEAQELFDLWLEEEDPEQRKQLEEQLRAKLDAVIGNYARQYGGQRGLYILANLAFEKEEWGAAAESYLALADRFPQSYLAALSVFNAAVCVETTGDSGRARTLYGELVEDYGDSYLVPHALFSVGRISEGLSEYQQALGAYTRLEEEHPFSLWTQVAQNRVIALEVSGKTEE